MWGGGARRGRYKKSIIFAMINNTETSCSLRRFSVTFRGRPEISVLNNVSQVRLLSKKKKTNFVPKTVTKRTAESHSKCRDVRENVLCLSFVTNNNNNNN